MDTFTVLPFVVAFMAGLCAMRALDIYQINAWNIGTLKADPWRVRSNGIQRALSALRGLFIGRWRALACIGAAMALALLASHVAASHAAPGVLTAAIVVGTGAEMRDRREKLIRDAGDLMGANNTFETDDKRAQFDGIMKDVEAYRVALDDVGRSERLAEIARQTLPESQRQAAGAGAAGSDNPEQNPEQRRVYERALGLYIRGVDMSEMAAEERSALRAGYQVFSGERRDMSTISGAAGGFLVSPDTRFYGTIIQAMKFFGGMEAVGAEVIETDTAGDLPVPMGDDTGNVGARVPEATVAGHAGGTSPTLSQLMLHGYLYSSKVVKVSWQMLRDGAVNVEGYVGGLLGERLARIQNTEFTTFAGNGGPQGLTPVVAVGKQSAVGNTTSIPFDDVYRTIHSVDVAYRTPKAKWMFHDTTALAYRLAKDGNGRYLWPEMGSTQAGIPASLGGYGYVVNNDMPVLAASAKHSTFGDHSYYKIRRIRGITIVRINELYVEAGQVGFLAFQSADGGYANAGQNPIKALQNSAT